MVPVAVHENEGSARVGAGWATFELVFVLGIDPGLSRCGYACLEPAARRTVRAVAIGVLTTPAADPLPQRLAALRADLAALIAELHPDVVAVEQVFFQVNVRTAM